MGGMFDNGNVNWCMLGRVFLCRTGHFCVEPGFLCRTMHFAADPGFFVSNECYNNRLIKSCIGTRPWISNYIIIRGEGGGGAITHPWLNFSGGLIKLPLKLKHGWVITTYKKVWLLMHVLISVKDLGGIEAIPSLAGQSSGISCMCNVS